MNDDGKVSFLACLVPWRPLARQHLEILSRLHSPPDALALPAFPARLESSPARTMSRRLNAAYSPLATASLSRTGRLAPRCSASSPSRASSCGLSDCVCISRRLSCPPFSRLPPRAGPGATRSPTCRCGTSCKSGPLFWCIISTESSTNLLRSAT